MGGAQPLAVTMNEGICIIADVCLERLHKRLRDRYLDTIVDEGEYLASIDCAIDQEPAVTPRSIGVCCNVVDLLERMLQRNIIPDIVTDQTSAHDPLNGYYPNGMTREEADKLRIDDPDQYTQTAIDTMTDHVGLMVELQKRGAVVFDYGNNIRQRAFENGMPHKDAFAFPGFVPAYIRPQFCTGRGPFRWAALSGDPDDIRVTDDAILELFPPNNANNKSLHRWIHLARERVAFQGLPARICWLGLGERDKAGLKFNELVRDGKVKAPIVIGRDHLDCGSVASPNRETEAMKDGSDAISDWALLNFAVNAVSGASWVSFHHGGGVGIGYSQHAGQVIVCDGTKEADERIKRVLTNDPMMGIFRHADAGYEIAEKCADELGVKIPMQT